MASTSTPSIADTVNGWFADRIATGAIGRNTEAYNQAQAALADLITRLGGTTTAPASAADLAAAQKAQARAAKIAADEAALAADEAAPTTTT